MRIITDETYAQLVQVLLQDDKVALFQRLVLSEKTDEQEASEATPKEGQED